MISIFTPTANTPIQWSWVTLSGPDAKDFLHRLTTVNVKGLPPDHGAPGCFLNPQGKIRAYFNLWHYQPMASDSEYGFEFDAGLNGKWKTDLLTIIDQYTFGEKILLQDATLGMESRWIFLENVLPAETPIGHLAPGETKAIDEEIRICHHGIWGETHPNPGGRLWISAWGRPARLNQWIDRYFSDARQVSFSEWEAWRVEALQPRIDLEITDSVMPLEIGLQNSVAENKGCYPGQEVIEKIIARGSPPRRLVRISGQSAPVPGDPILNFADPPAEVGQVTSVIQQDQKFIALGLVRKIHAKEGLQVQFPERINSIGVIDKVTPYER